MELMRRLQKVVALANRPGTAGEGAAARARAVRLAERSGVELVETREGRLVAMDSFHADLARSLQDIIEGRKRSYREIS